MNITQGLEQKLNEYFSVSSPTPFSSIKEWSPYEILYHPETGLLSVDQYVINHMDLETQKEWLHKLTNTSTPDLCSEERIIAIVSHIPDEMVPDLIEQTQTFNIQNSDSPITVRFNDSDKQELLNLHKSVVSNSVPLFAY